MDTLSGPLAAKRAEGQGFWLDVYGIEVHCERVFRVTKDGAIVHNARPDNMIGTYSQLRTLSTDTEDQIPPLIVRKVRGRVDQAAGEMVAHALSRENHRLCTTARKQAISQGRETKAVMAEHVLADVRSVSR